MTTGVPETERARVLTTFSEVVGSAPTVVEVALPLLETVAFTFMVIMSSPDTQPWILKIRPEVISRVTPVNFVSPCSSTSTSW